MPALVVLFLTLIVAAPLHAQPSATLQGRVFDASDSTILYGPTGAWESTGP